jgi:signal transduction histidine kinase
MQRFTGLLYLWLFAIPAFGRQDTSADQLNVLGQHAQDQRDYPSAIRYYRQCLEKEEASGNYAGVVQYYPSFLNIYFYTGNYPEAMKTAVSILAMAESHADTLQIAKCYNILGFIYFKQGDAHNSELYYRQYLYLSGRLGNPRMIADAYNNIGDLRLADHRWREALTALLRADSLYTALGLTERQVYTSDKISRAYKGLGDYRKALTYSTKAVTYWSSNEYDLAGYFINAGDIYKGLSDLHNAERMTRSGLILSQAIRHREDVMEADKALAEIFALEHRYDSAYIYYTHYASLKDSLSNEQIRKEIGEIHERYAVDKKDREIQLQKAQLDRQSLERNILLIASVLLIAVIGLLYNRRRLKQKADYDTRLFGAVIAVQDEERKRIAQDVHDTLGSILSAAKLNLSAHQYATSLTLLDQAAVELRNIAHNIMPAGLSKIGLPEAVKGHLDKIGDSHSLTVSFQAHGFGERLPEAVEISLYRILLELINNVIKHAGASRLSIQMIRYPTYVNVMVEDNGKGLDPLPARGMGLNNIYSRVGYLKGTIDVDAHKGTGTSVVIEVPCV